MDCGKLGATRVQIFTRNWGPYLVESKGVAPELKVSWGLPTVRTGLNYRRKGLKLEKCAEKQ